MAKAVAGVVATGRGGERGREREREKRETPSGPAGRCRPHQLRKLLAIAAAAAAGYPIHEFVVLTTCACTEGTADSQEITRGGTTHTL